MTFLTDVKVNKIIILGVGAFAREAYDWVSQSGYKVIGFFSNVLDNKESLRGLPIYYDAAQIPKDSKWILGSGNTLAIREMVELVKEHISASPAIVHPSSILGTNVLIGDGSILCPMSVITTDVIIGKNTLINLSCTIGHDCKIGDYVNISPNVSLSGRSVIGDNVAVGTGSVFIPSSSVPANSVIGAGCVVTKKLQESGVYIGAPARMLK